MRRMDRKLPCSLLWSLLLLLEVQHSLSQTEPCHQTEPFNPTEMFHQMKPTITVDPSHPVGSYKDPAETCTIFWSTATTVRLILFQNRTILQDRSHNIGESIKSLAWDPATSLFLWSDEAPPGRENYPNFIATMSFERGLPDEIWGRHHGFMRQLNLDWSTGNLYLLRENTIYVVKLRGTNQYLKTSVFSYVGINNLAIHPERGFFFWTWCLEGPHPKNCYLERSWLDGSHIKRLTSNSTFIREYLTIDYRQNIIYAANSNSIIAMDLDGKIFRTIKPKGVNKNLVHIDALRLGMWGKDLLVESRGTLLHVDTESELTGVIAKSEGGRKRDLKVYCGSSFPAISTPCTSENGECGTQQICVHTPDGVAKCYSHKRWL